MNEITEWQCTYDTAAAPTTTIIIFERIFFMLPLSTKHFHNSQKSAKMRHTHTHKVEGWKYYSSTKMFFNYSLSHFSLGVCLSRVLFFAALVLAMVIFYGLLEMLVWWYLGVLLLVRCTLKAWNGLSHRDNATNVRQVSAQPLPV